MTARIVVIDMRDDRVRCSIDDGEICINTTSRSHETFRQLSPFYLGPCTLYDGHRACNVENAWQYSKVYAQHAGRHGPAQAYYAWAQQGWANPRAVRYPMGRGAVPCYSFWRGRRYDYVQARARIYIPLYARAVRSTRAFEELVRLRDDGDVRTIYLRDFDGYDHVRQGSTLTQVLTDPTRKMGHAFVLAMMLAWGENFYEH